MNTLATKEIVRQEEEVVEEKAALKHYARKVSRRHGGRVALMLALGGIGWTVKNGQVVVDDPSTKK